jgi:hypothetical protein
VRNQQQRRMQAYLDRNAYGLGAAAPVAGTQQGDAALVGSSLLSAAAQVGKVDPIAGAVLAVAGAMADIVSMFGPNPNNTYATEVVNQVEADVMQPNLAAWQSGPTANKTLANQAAAEANFNSGWAYVLSACNNSALGSAGINCIKDRQRGGKFDWFKLYYDPIATDPAPAANALASASAATAAGTGTGTNPIDTAVSSITASTGLSPLVLGMILIGGALLLVSD